MKRKHKILNSIKEFSVIGQNVSGLCSKKESLFSVINSLSPLSSILLQETKVNKVGMLKLKDYQIFENVRKNRGVGGLLTAVLNHFNPVIIESNEDVDILVVEVSVSEGKLRLINAYGPQEYDQIENKLTFLRTFEEEIIKAKENGALVLV